MFLPFDTSIKLYNFLIYLIKYKNNLTFFAKISYNKHMKNIFNKKFYMSIVCLLLVAIIPLCSINLINYSNLLATTSQEETIDDNQDETNTENGSSLTDDGSESGESENAEENIDSDIADDSSDVSVSADDEYWTDSGNYTQPTQGGGV